MRIAVFDLGTNSVRFDVHELIRPGVLQCVFRRKEMVRLGEGLFRGAKLKESSMSRTEAMLKSFCKEIERLEVDRIVAGATSATREAKNGKKFMKRIRDNLGIHFQIIDGVNEARLIMKGIETFEPLASSDFSFVDIGGGSTEVGVMQAGEIVYLESFSLGSIRLAEWISGFPAPSSDLAHMRKQIRQELQTRCGFKDWPRVEFLFGCSGTIKAISRMMKEAGHGRDIKKKDLKSLVTSLSSCSLEELALVPGLEARRADIIVPGAVLLEEVMDFFHAKSVRRSRYALREGLLAQELEASGIAVDKIQIIFSH